MHATPTTVIASEAKQSTPPYGDRMDCFVASLLAMTEQVGWAKARQRRAHQSYSAAQMVGTLRFAHPTRSQ
jgi:hypothetical protein